MYFATRPVIYPTLRTPPPIEFSREWFLTRVIIVGAGFGGLAQALLSAKKGDQVLVIEKNEMAGGRSSVYSEKGY